MSQSKIELHGDNFDYCRLCLNKPKADQQLRFFDIFPISEHFENLSGPIQEFLGIEVRISNIIAKLLKYHNGGDKDYN